MIAMKKGFALALAALLLVCLTAVSLADGGGEWFSSKFNGYVQMASYVGNYNGWMEIPGYGGVTLTESTDVRVISRNASVWAQAKTNSDKLGTVYNGDDLQGRVDEYGNIIMKDGFYGITYNGRDAWINSWYTVCGPFEIVLMEGNVPAFSTPNRSSKRVGSLDKLTKYTVIGFYNDFYVINLREASAFVPMNIKHYDTTFMRYYHAWTSFQGRTTSQTTVRTGPGDNYTRVYDMNEGQSFEYLDVIDGWCLVYDNSRDCYVYIDTDATDVTP